MADRQTTRHGCSLFRFAGFIMSIITLVVWPGCLYSDSNNVTAAVLRHWPPQYELNEYGQPSGFAIDILEEVAALANLEVIYQMVDSWEEAFDALKNGHADLIPNHGITPERKEWFAFTSPVETFLVVIFVRQSTLDINHPGDLSGHVIATIKYNVGTRLMNHFSNIEHKVFLNVNEAFLELLAGQVDALIYPQPVLMKLAMEAGLEDRIKVVGPPLAEIKRAISVRKDNEALLKRLEPAVKGFVLSKKYEEIYARWYGRPNPYWTPKRLIIAMTGLIFILALWHTLRVTKVNRQLKQSFEDQKRAEAALRAGEEKYRLIVENQSDLTIKLDADGRLLFASPSFCETFGISNGHIEESRFITLIHWQDREKVKLAMQSLQVAPYACCHEGRGFTPNGWQWFSWSCKAILDSDGQVKEIIAVGRNTTERKEAELKLRTSEERFRAIFEQAADAVVLLNMQTLAVAEFNAAAHQALGYTQNEFSNINLRNLVVPEPAETISMVIEKVLECGQDPVEVMLRAKSGQLRYYLMKQRPLTFNGGKFLLGIWHDITERKMLEEHLVQSQKMEAIGTLAGGVAHDFNNILSIILGNTELAIQDIPEGHPAGCRLQEIQTAGTRAKDVVRQLLNFSRKGQENHAPVSLVPLVEESLQLLRASIPATIDMRKHVFDTEMTLMADATQIHQVLINLCTNAAQAMTAEGGIIDITLLSTVLDEQVAHLYDIEPGAYAQISIEDTGCGIDPDIMERIFDPYFTTKKTHGGTGMGLSIVHSIVSRHNGAIDVESLHGQGTVFKILLPLTEKSRPKKEVSAEKITTGDERILFIDDEQSIAHIGGEYLKKLGYHVQTFTSATKALAKFKTDPSYFDLMITDSTMPELTGEALAEETLKLRPDMPVILCSGYHGKVDEKKIAAIGIKAFLHKPYNMKILASIVRKVLTEKVGG